MSELDVRSRIESLTRRINSIAALMPTLPLRDGMLAMGTDIGPALRVMLERIEKLERQLGAREAAGTPTSKGS